MDSSIRNRGEVSDTTDYGPKEVLDPVPGTDARNFIQWKGTELCMDFYCPCGHHSHFDGLFAHFIKCGGCAQVYQLGTQVRAFKVEGREPYLVPLEDQSDYKHRQALEPQTKEE